jgi:hypothetical protein
MRITVTLDPDVEVLIRRAMKERGLSFEEMLNSAVRTGLARPIQSRHPFVQKTFNLGSEQKFRLDKALIASDAIEDKELRQKLSLRK